MLYVTKCVLVKKYLPYESTRVKTIIQRSYVDLIGTHIITHSNGAWAPEHAVRFAGLCVRHLVKPPILPPLAPCV